jgi:dipeptidyl aminopeptidase/acylaminoacyl peptidase
MAKYTLDEVDKSKIAITGHSRNAKQSLLAAAFDDRITAVISSSGGTGGEFPFRYTDERHSKRV